MSDKKPWEEWTWEEAPHPRVSFPTRVGAQASGIIMGGVPLHEEKVEMVRFISAAPDMARALLASGRRNSEFEGSAWHTHDCWENRRASCSKACVATVAALAKAGVPLP